MRLMQLALKAAWMLWHDHAFHVLTFNAVLTDIGIGTICLVAVSMEEKLKPV